MPIAMFMFTLINLIFLLKWRICCSSAPSVKFGTLVWNTQTPETVTIEGIFQYCRGIPVDSFLGIPYAEPPLNNFRFKNPMPHKGWRGTLKAKEMPPSCPQSRGNFSNPFSQFNISSGPMSEDCLYLNIWKPTFLEEELPVVVLIHGGGFQSGSSSLPENIGKCLANDANVIVVSLNYRLGVFGFLKLDSYEAPGNMGLLDQQLALRWINANINKFKGNPSQITLVGNDAGAASIGYHLLSRHSGALFRRAFMSGGSPLSPWAFINIDKLKKLGEKFLTAANCNEGTLRVQMRCLKGLSSTTLVNLQSEFLTLSENGFVPTIDGGFIDDKPFTLLNRGLFKKTELMTGVTNDEGSLFLKSTLFNHQQISMAHFEKILTVLFPRTPEIVREYIKFTYTEWLHAANNTIRKRSLIDMIGDFNFKCPIVDFSLSFAKYMNNVYLYSFHNTSNAYHGSDYKMIVSKNLLTNPFKELVWNFIKTGNPNKNNTIWPQWRSKEKRMMVVGNSLNYKTGPNINNCAFWRELYQSLQKHYKDYKLCR
uniref:Acetylcholinesterase 3 n=1 Tax=Hofstenia miamia TaxID=442651 RepID=A0A7G7LK70_HOFMI|nr:acetylcholinesterase 3 [Hofstenia miamia]